MYSIEAGCESDIIVRIFLFSGMEAIIIHRNVCTAHVASFFLANVSCMRHFLHLSHINYIEICMTSRLEWAQANGGHTQHNARNYRMVSSLL